MELRAGLEFTLESPILRAPVAVRLRAVGGRWVAQLTGGAEGVAIAPDPRRALARALEPLGPRAVSHLLADLRLLEPSLRLVQGGLATRT